MLRRTTVALALLLATGCDCGSGTTTADDAGGEAEVDGAVDAPEDDAADEAAEAEVEDVAEFLEDVVEVPPDCSLPEPPPEALLQMGLNPDGTRLIPGGRTVTPAGPETILDGFPQDVEVHPDGAVAYVVSASDDDRLLYVVDVETGGILQRIERAEAFYGLAVHPDGTRVFSSNGVGGDVDVFNVLPDGTLTAASAIDVGGYPAGLAMNATGSRLWVARFDGGVIGNGIVEIDAASLAVRRTIPLAAGVWDVVWVPGRDELYASALAGDRIHVALLDLGVSLASVVATSSPAGLAVRPDGTRIYAAVSGGDEVIAIHPVSQDIVARAWVGDFALPGETTPARNSNPNAVWYEPSSDRLYVTRGGDNAVLVLDADDLTVLGAIPTGWYPTDLAFTPDGARMVVSHGKSGSLGPNPGRDIKDWVAGSVMVVDLAAGDLATWTAQVEANFRRPETVFPFDFPAECEPPFPIPLREGDVSPIEHVVLVVKENKTFDCVFGDFPGAEADAGSEYLHWGREITPNQHKLAEEFTLHDNFYTDSEVSVQGHLWLTGMFVTEYMERVWIEDYRSGGFEEVSVLDQGQPDVGTFFQHLIRHGIDFTNYGEVVGTLGSVGGETVLSHTDLEFPGVFFNMAVRDEAKARYVAEKLLDGDFPPFVFIGLPNDHTNGTRAGSLTPEAMINDNDYGLGLLVDEISHSPYWPTTAIFVVEDDPQSCADHIDAHRSFLLVISPWARRGHISHVHGSFLSVYRTIERILGLPPLGRTDAAATPLYDAFTNVPDETPYMALPRTVPDDVNPGWYPGAERSATLDFRGPDRCPELFPVLRAYRMWQRGELSLEEAREAAGLPSLDEEAREEAGEETDEYDRAWAAFERWLAEHPEVQVEGLPPRPYGPRDFGRPRPSAGRRTGR
ncbi:MAG: bifunctional YncE family protein/alkaline phosphatase family protein [Deltaproteobacteria bacterium]|nr:bifunctional YncE family protein/alkaline phosphatase family protein [Deltaproteobacteria bacterium]